MRRTALSLLLFYFLSLPLSLLLGNVAGARAAPVATPLPGDGVDVVIAEPRPQEPERTAADYAAVWREIHANTRALAAQGKLPPTGQTPPLLDWPLRPVRGASLTDFGYFVIANYVDHDPAFPNRLLDYACGVMTYDSSGGYNHQGTDILLTPFQWRKMDNDEVAVTAAAPGVIVYKQDGQYDRSCGYTGQQWNAVYVRHADGSTAWYGHLKSGSVTAKGVGDSVVTGEVLGLVGSSGNSSTPHLHFELYDADGNLVDPFAGQCNATTDRSWWREQPPYREAGVNKLTTGDAAPEAPTCPSAGDDHARERFTPGEQVYFTAYFRHFAPGARAEYEILRPDGSPFRGWTYTHTGDHLTTAWIYRTYRLEADAPAGQWTFAVTFAGKRYTRSFTVATDAPTPTVAPPPTSTAPPPPTATPSPVPTPTPTSTPPPTATPQPSPTPRPAYSPTPTPYATAPAEEPPSLDRHIYLPSIAGP